MRARLSVLIGLLLFGALAIPAASAASTSSGTILEFDTMAPVTEPFTGDANPIRGVPGGGLPWEIDSAKGELRSDGRVEIEVEGLVLARRDPVPEQLQGTNPVPSFQGVVSCVTAEGDGPATVNSATALAPASTTGDAKIEGTVDLPTPCLAPIVFVTSPTGAWFSVTGR